MTLEAVLRVNIFRYVARRYTLIVDNDIFYSFRRSPVTVVAAIITLVYLVATLFAPVVAPHNSYDLTSLSLLDAFLPPAWVEGGSVNYLL